MANGVMSRDSRGATTPLRRARNFVLALPLVLLCTGALSGCVVIDPTPIAATIRVPPKGDLQLVETSAKPVSHSGASVRWGGNVIEVEHDSAGNALIQVIERRLDADGRPIEGSASDGRFMIKASAAVDRQFYARDRMITVAGTIDGNTTVRVSEKTLTVPVVHVNEFMLWLPNLRDGPYWRHYDDYWYGSRIGFGHRSRNYQHRHRP
ncbi:MAG: outer membrane lipoprotein [Gammaproteobacteria bacterium]|jgi:outer membrane lipoprotein